MSFKERLAAATKKQWVKMSIAEILCILFIFWSGYYIVMLVMLLLFDSYITKYIPWSFWKKSKNTRFRKIMEWVDSISFALVAVYFINTFFFQNYQIPSSSLEKSLLVGDFLCVSKLSYGARSPMTPFSFPLVQHTLPIFNCKSYLDKPQVEYKRLAGFGHVKRGDIVVFNFPAGDTVALKMQETDYYSLCKANGGRAAVRADKERFGDIVYRPVDRRENYVKRCVGLPGEFLEIKNDVIYNDGVRFQDPENVQHNYMVQTTEELSDELFEELGISDDDSGKKNDHSTVLENIKGADSTQLVGIGLKYTKGSNLLYHLPLTKKMIATLKSKSFVLSVVDETNKGGSLLYPIDYPNKTWKINNYGPIWIPKRGAKILFDTDVAWKVATYGRCIKNYEYNDLVYKDGKVYINGKLADSYTFNYDYYFMMGDNRDNSADSRYWGFVPEDHIVGQPMFIWLSLDKDKGWFSGKVRWNRLFTSASKK